MHPLPASPPHRQAGFCGPTVPDSTAAGASPHVPTGSGHPRSLDSCTHPQPPTGCTTNSPAAPPPLGHQALPSPPRTICSRPPHPPACCPHLDRRPVSSPPACQRVEEDRGGQGEGRRRGGWGGGGEGREGRVGGGGGRWTGGEETDEGWRGGGGPSRGGGRKMEGRGKTERGEKRNVEVGSRGVGGGT